MDFHLLHAKIKSLFILVIGIIIFLGVLGTVSFYVVSKEHKKLNYTVFPILFSLESLNKNYMKLISEVLSVSFITLEKHYSLHGKGGHHSESNINENQALSSIEEENEQAEYANFRIKEGLNELQFLFDLQGKNQSNLKVKELTSELKEILKILQKNQASGAHGLQNLELKEQLEDLENLIFKEINNLINYQKTILYMSEEKIDYLKSFFISIEVIFVGFFIFGISILYRYYKKFILVFGEQQNQIFESSKFSAVGVMAAGIAHEVNNPLAIISLKTQVLLKEFKLDKFTKEGTEKELNNILFTIDRIGKIIQGLREISYQTDGKIIDNIEAKEFLDNVLSLVREKFKTEGIELIFDENSPLLMTKINCNRVQLSQVLLNLVNNAFDVVKEEEIENRWIRLTLSTQDNKFILRVCNSGKRISSSVAKKLFTPFYSTKGIGKGMGLGLSVSRAIVERHNGTIFLDKEKPNTCFVVELPLEIKNG